MDRQPTNPSRTEKVSGPPMGNIKYIEVEVLVMFGDECDENGVKTGKRGYFKVRDIYKIVSHSPKKNYHVPLFYTRTGNYSMSITLESLRELLEEFGILLLDVPNLVNLNNVVDFNPTTSNAVFENGLTAVVSQGNKKIVKDFLSNKD